MVKPLLENKTVCQRLIRKERLVIVEVRDITFVLGLHLTDKDPNQ